jgi:hexosaminidase
LKTMNSIGKILQAMVLLLALFGCSRQIDLERISIIPLPVEIKPSTGEFAINENTIIVYKNDELEFLGDYASNLWSDLLGYKLISQKIEGKKSTKSILLKINKKQDKEIGEEGYQLKIKRNRITINANSKAGILYGIQSVYQLLGTNQNGAIPCLSITDYPRFQYRGMHLDVSRHFHSIEFIYKMLDRMAMHKLNTFHWHLIDDQGWRLEIMKYPKLTEVGAWRVDMSDRHWNDRPLVTDRQKATYGGFYTQDEVKAVVAYAAQRNITVMPEIEMPAHVMSALAAYPEYSCTGENLGVPPGGVWPITHIYCAGNDETFNFLEDVLTEVLELFPSKFIHIGGDEANKTEWKQCAKCQKRINDEGLEDENELQSYFIKRIEKFLNEHDRVLVGWDEILEGGLAPNAIVMSWRGEGGGIEAAKQGNQAIMTPGSHCYFDHYQGDPSIEPIAFGGNTTLKKVYHYEPIPAELNVEQAKFILGAQANLWTEFIPTSEHAEYMFFPRLAALSEVLWSPKATRDWENFSHRMEHQYNRYKKLGINFSLSAFQVSIKPELDPQNKTLNLSLSTEAHNPEIRYTLDGEIPNGESPVYESLVVIDKSTTLRSVVFKDGVVKGNVRSTYFNLHKAFATKVDLKFPNSPRYDGQGEYSLVDGIVGSTSFSDGNWKGFLGNGLEATIDLEKQMDIKKISVDALQDITSWIFFPSKVTIAVSSDGVHYKDLQTIQNKISPYQGGRLTQVFESNIFAERVRFVRVSASNIGVCPKGHSGEGKAAWLFVSEITIE